MVWSREVVEGLRSFSQLDASFISDNYRRRTPLYFQINNLLFFQFIYCLCKMDLSPMLPIERYIFVSSGNAIYDGLFSNLFSNLWAGFAASLRCACQWSFFIFNRLFSLWTFPTEFSHQGSMLQCWTISIGVRHWIEFIPGTSFGAEGLRADLSPL